MTAIWQDRQAISDLMTGWIHRDLGEWDRLRDLFHPDGRIEVTWFKGPAAEFVEASARMGAGGFHSKHLLTAPALTFCDNATRAVAETNVVIIGENPRIGLGATAHGRFIDRIERRGETWRILHRASVYDLAHLTFPAGPVEIDTQEFTRHPHEYRSLAYLLERSGQPVQATFPTRGSDLEREIKQSALTWLRDTDGT